MNTPSIIVYVYIIYYYIYKSHALKACIIKIADHRQIYFVLLFLSIKVYIYTFIVIQIWYLYKLSNVILK